VPKSANQIQRRVGKSAIRALLLGVFGTPGFSSRREGRYLHDVSLMLVKVEGAHGGEGGAPGQLTWRT
jgi:hypothetical protein